MIFLSGLHLAFLFLQFYITKRPDSGFLINSIIFSLFSNLNYPSSSYPSYSFTLVNM